MRKGSSVGWVALCVLLTCCVLSEALIHELDARVDNRKKFFVENFGFEAGGVIHLSIEKFSVSIL